MIAALRFRINEDYSAFIYPVGTYNNVDWENEWPCPLGDDFCSFMFKVAEDNMELMNIATSLDGRYILRLTETKRYIIRIQSASDTSVKLPFLQNQGNKSLKLDRDKNSVVFQFVNYIGRSRIAFPDHEGKRELLFEVVPDKMDYEDDYIELTEALAERCSELLLDYSGSTSNVFTSSENEAETLFEQFIFLRQFCFSDNIQSLLGQSFFLWDWPCHTIGC